MLPNLVSYDPQHVSTHDRIDIEKLIKTKIAPLPGTVLRISALLRDVNVSTRQLAEAVGCDPMLTARLLRLANSPYYSLRKNITSVQFAIEAIGTRTLYEIVMLGLTADSFAKEIRNSVLGRLIWEHSLTVALLSRELSNILGMRGSEDSFICGLLHDIGKIMLLRADVERFTGLLENKEENEMLNREYELFGYTHAQVGALVAKRWSLPESVSHVILHHHNASQADQSVIMAHLVNVADIVANINGYGLRLEDESALWNSESIVFLRLTEDQIETAWNNIQDGLQDVIKMFHQ